MQLLKIISRIKAFLKKPLLWICVILFLTAMLAVQGSALKCRNATINTLTKELSQLRIKLEIKNKEVEQISRQALVNEGICREQAGAREEVKEILVREKCPENPAQTGQKREEEVITYETSRELIDLLNRHLSDSLY